MLQHCPWSTGAPRACLLYQLENIYWTESHLYISGRKVFLAEMNSLFLSSSRMDKVLAILSHQKTHSSLKIDFTFKMPHNMSKIIEKASLVAQW